MIDPSRPDDSSNIQADAQPISFKAEIRQLLDILIHSLYTEREIFLRELISNASDALHQMRFEMLTNRTALDPEAELCIRISADAEKGLLTIADTGIGLTREELIENLGTIAHSGARDFLAAIDKGRAAQESQPQISDIIGQFGVGFYSVFMVAEWVKVTSRSFKPEEQAYAWYATGGESYQVTAAQKESRGTVIEIKLKEDAKDFAQESHLRQIVRKHSDYVAFPIYWADGKEPINKVTALWRQRPSDVSEAQYNDFYKQLTYDFEEPLLHIHVATDAPVQVYALFYIPARGERSFSILGREEGLQLYSHNILIQNACKELLPIGFRFISGVVDSEDLPLNVSRESVQSNLWMARLKKVLSGRVVSALKELSLKDKEKYLRFWMEHGKYLKEGIASTAEAADREALYPLLRFHTTKFPEEWSSLDEYVGRMKSGQKVIYYLIGDDPRSVTRSPHLDYFVQHGYEVILFSDVVDAFMTLAMTAYEGFALENAISADLPEGDEGKPEAATEDASGDAEAGGFGEIIKRFKNHLGEKVVDVRASRRLTGSLARLVDSSGTHSQDLERVFRMIGREGDIPKKILELNPEHPILRSMGNVAEESDLNATLIDLVFENALWADGLHPEPAAIIPLTQKLMAYALSIQPKESS
jgi:molecular chaperone HtpG